MTQAKNIKKIIFYDLFEEKAKEMADWAKKEYGVETEVSADLPALLGEADIVTVAASRIKPLFIEKKWLKKGALVLLSGPVRGDDEFWTDSKIVYDHIGLHEAYVEEALASGDKNNYYSGVIGGPIYNLIDQDKLIDLKDSTDIGHVILGTREGRINDEENIVFVACGMAVFDVAWGYELYKRALEKGIGQKLLLWDVPALS